MQYCVYNCFTSASFPWLITCFLYLALLQFIAVVLAIQTRNVKIRILNDSKEVAIIIYFTSFVMIVMLASTFILSDYNNVSDGIFGSSLMISTSVTLIVVFLPKVKFNFLWLMILVVETFNNLAFGYREPCNLKQADPLFVYSLSL